MHYEINPVQCPKCGRTLKGLTALYENSPNPNALPDGEQVLTVCYDCSSLLIIHEGAARIPSDEELGEMVTKQPSLLDDILVAHIANRYKRAMNERN